MPRAFSRKSNAEPTVQAMRRESAERTGCEKLAGISTEKEARKTLAGARTREAGIQAILAPAVAAKEGARVLVFGRTRWGKSSLATHLVRAAIDSGVAGTVLVHDVKYPDRPQYDGASVEAITQIGAALQRSDVIVCRPPFPADEAAHAARVLAESGEKTLLLVDETRRCLGGSQIWCDGKAADGSQGPRDFEWLCLEGGGVGASLVLLVQRPRQVPGDAVDSAQVNVVMGLGGRSLTYLASAGTVPPEAVEVVRTLPPGAFCVFSDDDTWNGEIYYSPE